MPTNELVTPLPVPAPLPAAGSFLPNRPASVQAARLSAATIISGFAR